MTANQEVETAVACMKEGAFDYLVKPVEESRFVSSIKRALELRTLRRQVDALKRYLISDELEHGEVFRLHRDGKPQDAGPVSVPRCRCQYPPSLYSSPARPVWARSYWRRRFIA